MSDSWRPVIALLANPEGRRAAARIMLGETIDSALEGLAPSRARRLRATLVQSGLVHPDTGEFSPDAFRAILNENPVTRRQGIERFVDGTRIRQYPAGARERAELLTWVARRVFTPGEVLTEREVNERLVEYSEDVAVLRRYLVDHGLVERRSDGGAYALVTGGPTARED